MSDVNSISGAAPEDRRRWVILGVIGIAQLMVVLDVTIMNIALPSAQRSLNCFHDQARKHSQLGGPTSAVRGFRRRQKSRDPGQILSRARALALIPRPSSPTEAIEGHTGR